MQSVPKVIQTHQNFWCAPFIWKKLDPPLPKKTHMNPFNLCKKDQYWTVEKFWWFTRSSCSLSIASLRLWVSLWMLLPSSENRESAYKETSVIRDEVQSLCIVRIYWTRRHPMIHLVHSMCRCVHCVIGQFNSHIYCLKLNSNCHQFITTSEIYKCIIKLTLTTIVNY